ncbi:MAG: Hsp33 family molecular chaperone HslO [Kiritimatiellales bacterium]|nr:Hsp33 family molecular chaperone HslO [Kiritimatiellales bacterium]
MEDTLYKGHFKGLDIAFTYAVTTGAVNEAVVRHDCDPVAAHILGRAMTGALLAAALQPEGRRINACWKYDGALRSIVVDAGQDGSVGGVISPPHLSGYTDNPDLLYGDIGDLQVITTEDGKILNSGTAPIPLHDVARDLAYYFCISDQVETGMNVMIGFSPDTQHPVKLCQGWMIQALPGTDLERFDRIRRRMEDSGFRELLSHAGEVDNHFENLANALVGGEGASGGIHMEACPVPHFQCTCNREKMEDVVRAVAIPERMEMVKKGESIKVLCQFCNERYELTIDDCIAAWNRKPAE